jgi:hypothetical protein
MGAHACACRPSTAIFALTELSRHTRRVRVAGTVFLALGVAWFLGPHFTGPWDGTAGVGFALLFLLLLVLAGVPIALVLAVTAYVYIYRSGEADPMAVSFALTNGISSFILPRVPFFISAGKIMTDGGLTKPLADRVTAFVGRLQGGPPAGSRCCHVQLLGYLEVEDRRCRRGRHDAQGHAQGMPRPSNRKPPLKEIPPPPEFEQRVASKPLGIHSSGSFPS